MLIAHLLPQPRGFYVDAGAHDPWRYSNTALLHLRGWRGLNIDADDRAIARFNEARPDDINVHCGVGAAAGEMSFARFTDGAVNSFDPAMAAQQTAAFGEAEVVRVRIEPLGALMASHVPAGVSIDYLNIDCEGLDFDVLQGHDWQNFAPRVISVELHGLDLAAPQANPAYQLLREKGYLFRGHYFCTSIFQHLSCL
jgi:FkbM family methyltransferase